MVRETVPAVSIVIVNWNSYELVEACLRSLANNGSQVSFEVIIVDNSSSEPLRTRWFDALPGRPLTVVPLGVNVGFAAANNVGIQKATAELILLLNPDTLVPPGSLARLVATMSAERRVGILGPQLLNKNGSRQTSWYQVFPSVRAAALDALGLLWFSHTLRPWTAQHSSPLIPVKWTKGACMLARRTCLDEIGLLDEQFFMYCEDADLCKRAAAAGWNIAVLTTVNVFHLGGGSARLARPQTVRAYYGAYLRFVRKHSRPRARRTSVWLTAALLRVAALARFAALVALSPSSHGSWKEARAYLMFALPLWPTHSPHVSTR